eukprot:3345368-Rhodomonas_salina.4
MVLLGSSGVGLTKRAVVPAMDSARQGFEAVISSPRSHTPDTKNKSGPIAPEYENTDSSQQSPTTRGALAS